MDIKDSPPNGYTLGVPFFFLNFWTVDFCGVIYL